MEQVLYGPPHVKCLHVLYDSYGPHHTLYGIGILWSPITLYGTGIIWSTMCTYGFHPHVKCLHVLYDSYGPPSTLYGIGIVWSPHMYVWSPPDMYDMIFQASFERGPLRVLTIQM